MDAVRDYAIFVLDPAGHVLTWNRGAQHIKGYSEEEILGKHFSLFYTQADLARNHPQNELMIATRDGRFEEEGWRLRKDGTRFWANVVITALRDARGNVSGFSKVTRDLTERRRTQEALRASEERFRQLVEGVKDYAIFLIDPQGIVSTWNEGASRLKGYLPDEIVGQHFSKFYLPEEVRAGKCEFELKEARMTGRYEEEGWRIRKDGTLFWASVVITALRDARGNVSGFSKVTRDLTERRRAEERLRLANEELERRVQKRTEELSQAKLHLENAMQARDEFLSIASHELKTPITSLKLQAQMALARYDLAAGKIPAPEKTVSSLETVLRQANRLATLIEYMLDVSRVHLGKFTYQFETLNLSELLQSVVRQWADPLQSAGNTLDVNMAPNVIAQADPYRLEQAVANLLSNAMKYAPGSHVVLTMTLEPQTAVIRVADNGPGIDPANQSRIFERFERGRGVAGISGFGLGLYITRAIAQAHYGSIELDNRPGPGAAFTIRLPLNVEQAGPRQKGELVKP